MPDAAELAGRFALEYGAEPDTVCSAPGRVNLIGEHTDYNGGLVLPFAIDARTAVALRRRSDGTLRLRSLQRPAEPLETTLTAFASAPAGGWAAYAAGVLAVLRRLGHPVSGADILVDSDVPAGAGLSSSAALECAVATAADAAWRLGLDRQALAAVAQAAENEFVGVPCGPMDQVAAMVARPGSAVLLDCGTGAVDLLPFAPAEHGLEILVVDTGVRHSLADGGYADRRSRCEQAARLLGVERLGDLPERAGSEALGRLPEGPVRAACRHVLTENARVASARDLLRQSRLVDLGPLLTASHVSLRDDLDVSCPELDVVVESLLGAGALGARLTGAGFGGSVVALVPAARTQQVSAAVARDCAAAGQPEPVLRTVTPAGGARRDLGG